MGVLSAWTPGGEFLGCVVNFTCHGTCGVGLNEYSADWPYFMDETIKGLMGREATVVFLNGACGDVTQVDNRSFTPPDFGPECGRFVGGRVGAEAVKVIVGSRERHDLAPISVRRAALRCRSGSCPPNAWRTRCAAWSKSRATSSGATRATSTCAASFSR